jgi:predicted GNAT family acetyltransferase
MARVEETMKPGIRQHGPATLKLSHNKTIPAHMRGGVMEVSHVTTPETHRRQGYASMLMQKVCAEADKAGIVLLLHVKPYGDSITMSRDELADWYSRYGFDPIQAEPMLMARPAGAQQRFTMKPLAYELH